MNFGTIDNFLLLGGGSLLIQLAKLLRERNRTVSVITSPRHAQEIFDGTRLLDSLTTIGIRVEVCEKLSEIDDNHTLWNDKTLALSFGAAWIFKTKFINKFSGRLLNVHGAKLPQERGAGGFSWLILRDLKLSCCLIHQVTTGVDDGPVIFFEEFSYPHSCRVPVDFQQYSIKRNLQFLHNFIDLVDEQFDFTIVNQPEYLSSYWPRLNTSRQAFINWDWTSQEIERFICAFSDPYSGATTLLKGSQVRLKDCFRSTADGTFHPFQTGIVYRKSKSGICIACRDSAIIVSKIESDESSNFSISVGDRFYTPSSYLESALAYRPYYSPVGLMSTPS